MQTTNKVLVSAILAGFLIGCGGGSSDNSSKDSNKPSYPEQPNSPTTEVGNLKKVEISNSKSYPVKKVASSQLNDYFEAGDARIVSISGQDDIVVAATKWHNSLSVISSDGSLKLTPYEAFKSAGHNKPDTVTGATEAEINKIAYKANNIFANIHYKQDGSFNQNSVGIHKVKVNADGSIAKVAKTKNGENYKDFIVSNDGSVILATDESNIISLNSNLQETGIKEREVLAWNFSKTNKPLVVYKDGINPIFTNNTDFSEVAKLNFLPTYIADTGNSILFVEETSKKPIKIYTLSSASRAITSGVLVPEIAGKGFSYDISPNGKFLAVGYNSGLSIVELYSGKMNVLYTKEGFNGNLGVTFLSNDKIAYTNGNSNIEVASFQEKNQTLTQANLIAQKLEKITPCDINKCLPFTEVRKDMDFSKTNILGALNVKYEPTGDLANYIASDGKLTQPNNTISGKLKLIGTLDGKVGVREISLTLIGKDVANTIALNNESVINANVFGDKVVVATSKGFRTYKIDADKLTAIGGLVKPNGIDTIAPYGTFENTITHKIDDTTIIGLGFKYTGKSIKTKGRRGVKEIKLYDTKVFKATLGEQGIDPDVSFIDVGSNNIVNIDVSGDKKTLGVVFAPSPKYIDDPKNAGYKKANETLASAMLYDLSKNKVKTEKFNLTRDAKDKEPETIISLNHDASKIMLSESHHGVVKLYNPNGTLQKAFGDDKFTGKLNHMSANFIVDGYIIGAPFKSSSLGYIDTNKDLNTLGEVEYAGGKGWYHKAFTTENKAYFATSTRYSGGKAGLATFDLKSKKLDLKEYKIYGGTTVVDFIDADMAGDKIIFSANREKDGYINIQSK